MSQRPENSKNGKHDHEEEGHDSTPRVDASQIEYRQKPLNEGRRRSESAARGSTSGTGQDDDETVNGSPQIGATAGVGPQAQPVGADGHNHVGLLRESYKGAQTTLCAGCGHNAITNHIIKALYEYGVEPHKLAKMSGIGCSSKAPAYFVSQAHGFNSVHGRMPSVATGAKMANRELIAMGISGDGDTASIGLGQFCHMVRRNVNMVYICENNGVYGLTKGQFSATADVGSIQKGGKPNEFETIDICGLAVELGASFVARSFSGDGKQLVPLIQAALGHGGTAILDIISPCVTFNDHEGSTKSYTYVKQHDVAIQELDFIPFYQNIEADYEEGTSTDVILHDGSHLHLRKLSEAEHDPTDRIGALRVIHEARAKGEVLTGLLYVKTDAKDLATLENIPQKPLRDYGEADLRPSKDAFESLMKEYA